MKRAAIIMQTLIEYKISKTIEGLWYSVFVMANLSHVYTYREDSTAACRVDYNVCLWLGTDSCNIAIQLN